MYSHKIAMTRLINRLIERTVSLVSALRAPPMGPMQIMQPGEQAGIRSLPALAGIKRRFLPAVILFLSAAQAAFGQVLPPQPGFCGPTDVAFVIDTTGSMQGAINGVKRGLTPLLDLIAQQSGGDYRLALVTFKDDVTVEENFAPQNRESFREAVEPLFASGGEMEPEASDEALNTVINALPAVGRPQNRDFEAFRPDVLKIVVLITDARPGGFDNAYTNEDDVNSRLRAEEARDLGILISAVDVPADGDETDKIRIMRRYADLTGGIYIRTQINGEGTEDALEEIISTCGGLFPPPPPETTGPCPPMDVVFVIDTSASMAQALEGIKGGIFALVLRKIARFSANDYRVGLVTFDDQIRVEQNLRRFAGTQVISRIQALTAQGGAGEADASDEALNTVINRLPAAGRPQTGNFTEVFREGAEKLIILMTDSRPGGFDDTFTPADELNANLRAQEARTYNVPQEGIRGRIDIITLDFASPEQSFAIDADKARIGQNYALGGGRWVPIDNLFAGNVAVEVEGALGREFVPGFSCAIPPGDGTIPPGGRVEGDDPDGRVSP